MADHSTVLLPNMREKEGLLLWSDRREKQAPLFAALHRAIAENDELFDLSLKAGAGQLCGRLLLSGVHAMLLEDPSDPLAAYFPTIVETPLPPSDAAPHLERFCQKHRDRLIHILENRTLQTTNPDRAAQILFALDYVAKSVGGPFSLVEVGCSAGLLLLFDHYRYEFENGAKLGPLDSGVVVSSFPYLGKVDSIPTSFPNITSRIGLDLDPVDVANPEERNWILGCTVADRLDEFKMLEKAVDYRAHINVPTVKGDAMKTLPVALATIEGPVCVLHSRCLYQWPIEAQAAFESLLKSLSLTRTIHRIGIEAADNQLSHSSSVSEISMTIYKDGKGESVLLGRIANKERLEWLV